MKSFLFLHFAEGQVKENLTFWTVLRVNRKRITPWEGLRERSLEKATLFATEAVAYGLRGGVPCPDALSGRGAGGAPACRCQRCGPLRAVRRHAHGGAHFRRSNYRGHRAHRLLDSGSAHAAGGRALGSATLLPPPASALPLAFHIDHLTVNSIRR